VRGCANRSSSVRLQPLGALASTRSVRYASTWRCVDLILRCSRRVGTSESITGGHSGAAHDRSPSRASWRGIRFRDGMRRWAAGFATDRGYRWRGLDDRISRSPRLGAFTEEGDTWTHRLSVGHFNALAGSNFAVPRYLVLVTVPSNAEEYAVCEPDGMRLRLAAYWASLSDRMEMPMGPDDQQTVTVRVPKTKLLTPASLLSLLARESGTGVR
jgi:hypothetical protein